MVFEIIGITGGCLLLFGFFAIASGRWQGTNAWYELCNLVGSLMLGSYSFTKEAYPNFVLSIVWASAAAHALYRTWRGYKTSKKHKQRKK